MEWLLLLLSAAVTGAIAYFLREGETVSQKLEKEKEEKEIKSSIPEVKQKVSLSVDKEDINKFKAFINEFPTPIQPEVKPTDNLKEEIQKIRRDLLRKKKPLKVTYTTDEIIPRSSPFSRHRRPLQNAEKFVEEQKAKEALNIYERLEKRIPDEEIKQKIRTNIEDIKKWLMGIEEEEPIEFPEIIIPLSAQIFALEQFNEGLKQISEQIAGEISKILREGVKEVQNEIRAREVRADRIISGGGISSEASAKEVVGGGGIVGGEAEREIRAREVRADRIISGGGISSEASAKEVVSRERGDKVVDRGGKVSGVENRYTEYYYYVPLVLEGEVSKKKGIVDIKDLQVPLPVGPTIPTYPGEYFRGFVEKEGFQFDKEGNLITEGMTDQDFEKEWEKYKHLPLIDRRSGVDRRKDHSYDPNRPDRRQGEDRRKKDLFKERDEFLEKYKKHQERKRAIEQDKQNKLKEFNQFLEKEDLPLLPTVIYKEKEEELEKILLPDPKQEPILEKINATKDLNIKDLETRSIPEEKREDIQLEKLKLPENIITEEFSIELPDSLYKENLEEKPSSTELQATVPPISKVEIVEPKLNTLFLPEPEEQESEIDVEDGLRSKQQRKNNLEEAPEDVFPSESENVEEPKETFPPEAGTTIQEEKQQLGEGVEELDIPEIPESPETKGPVQEIRGVLELKTPEEEDAPFLTLTYDFTKIPDSFQLSKNYHTLEYVYYKYKPLLIKAQEFARRKMIKNALNYYRMIKSQNIPPEFKKMINRNIQDITDYIQKFMMSRSE